MSVQLRESKAKCMRLLCLCAACIFYVNTLSDALSGTLPYQVQTKGLPAGVYEVQIEATDVFGFTDQSTVEYQREADMHCMNKLVYS